MTRKHTRRTKAAPPEQAFTSIEICAGAGGQAVGLHEAGFRHTALVEIDSHAIATLKLNIKARNVWGRSGQRCAIIEQDVNVFDPFTHKDLEKNRPRRGELDLLAGGVPCPPFSHAGKQLGKDDERDLFPRMLTLIGQLEPRAVMIENVRGIMDPKFQSYREWIVESLEKTGRNYTVVMWDVLEASDFGVPQLRPRAILVAFRNDVYASAADQWARPQPSSGRAPTVAESLGASMRERFEPYFNGKHSDLAVERYEAWLEQVQRGGIAPTLVGGSKKHGGADLGPSRAKAAWRQLGISGMGVANDPKTSLEKGTEERDLFRPEGPMLTVQQAAIIQGFPKKWEFAGMKTAQYRQVGNAFPPPVAAAVGKSIINVLKAQREIDNSAILDVQDESQEALFELAV
ncbi:DNA cytosine methyltransferase [Nocardia sp. NPDC127579]|uniref:DNA cytosine methyltransferase n=1 Tax=Nocardia sp. NPDC127579 TaxID=3345402 RepID=UPI00362ED8CC